VVPPPRPPAFGALLRRLCRMEAEVSRVVRDLEPPEPCKPPIHRQPTETTRQFIERAMRENHGDTVPARWLADPDAIPGGNTGEPESGYLVGIETPTDPTLLEPLLPNHGRQDTPTADEGGRMIGAPWVVGPTIWPILS
jgi:hypothetical protein